MKAELNFRRNAIRLDGGLEMSDILRTLSEAETRQLVAGVARVLDTFPPGQRWTDLRALLARFDGNTATEGDRALVAGSRMDVLQAMSRLQSVY